MSYAKAPLARSTGTWPMGARFRTTSGRGVCAERRACAPADRGGSQPPALQEVVTRHLVEHRGVRTQAAQIIVTPSAQAAIELIARVTLDAATWRGWKAPATAARAWRWKRPASSSRYPARPQRSRVGQAGSDRPRLILVTPVPSIPDWRLMPIDRRQELLRFAGRRRRRHHRGRLRQRIPLRRQTGGSAARPRRRGRVFYVGTFSKSMLADIRVGYTSCRISLVDTFEMAQRHTGQLTPAPLQDALPNSWTDGALRRAYPRA